MNLTKCLNKKFFDLFRFQMRFHSTYEFLIGPPIIEFPHQLPLQIEILKFYSHFARNIPENERIVTTVRQNKIVIDMLVFPPVILNQSELN